MFAFFLLEDIHLRHLVFLLLFLQDSIHDGGLFPMKYLEFCFFFWRLEKTTTTTTTTTLTQPVFTSTWLGGWNGSSKVCDNLLLSCSRISPTPCLAFDCSWRGLHSSLLAHMHSAHTNRCSGSNCTVDGRDCALCDKICVHSTSVNVNRQVSKTGLPKVFCVLEWPKLKLNGTCCVLWSRCETGNSGDLFPKSNLGKFLS